MGTCALVCLHVLVCMHTHVCVCVCAHMTECMLAHVLMPVCIHVLGQTELEERPGEQSELYSQRWVVSQL